MTLILSNSTVKPTLVFLPGWNFQSSVWQDCAYHLFDANVRLLDLPNFAAKTHANHSLKDLVYYLDTRIPKNSSIIGWSFGGLIGILLCWYFPKKYSHLIMVTSSPKFIEASNWDGIKPNVIQHIYTLAQKNLIALQHFLLKLIIHPSQDQCLLRTLKASTINVTQKNALMLFLQLLIKTDLRAIYQQLSQPILQIFGGEDAVLPLTASRQIINRHRQYTSHIIAGAGHIPFITHRSEFIDCIFRFLNAKHDS